MSSGTAVQILSVIVTVYVVAGGLRLSTGCRSLVSVVIVCYGLSSSGTTTFTAMVAMTTLAEGLRSG